MLHPTEHIYNLVGDPTPQQVTRGRALSHTGYIIYLSQQAASRYNVRTLGSRHKSLEGMEDSSRQRGWCEQRHGGAERSFVPKLSVGGSAATGDRGHQWVEGKRDSAVIRGQVKVMSGQQTLS